MPWRGTGGLADVCTKLVHTSFAPTAGAVYTDPTTSTDYELEQVVFDAAWEDVTLTELGPIPTTKPVLDIRLVELPVDPVEGAGVEVEGRTYEVVAVHLGDSATSAKLVLIEV